MKSRLVKRLLIAILLISPYLSWAQDAPGFRNNPQDNPDALQGRLGVKKYTGQKNISTNRIDEQKAKRAAAMKTATQNNPQEKGSFENPRFFVGRRSTSIGQDFFYDQQGNLVGRSQESGDRLNYYSGTGNYTGYSQFNSERNRTEYFDSKGNFIGYDTEYSNNNTRHYSSSGEYLGYSVNQDSQILQFDSKTGYKGKAITPSGN